MKSFLQRQFKTIKNRAKLTALILCISIFGIWKALQPTPLIKLHIGEQWNEMQKNSTASIKNPADVLIGYGSPEDSSSLFFDDKQFHFHTPKAKFFVVIFDEEKRIHSIRISPQMDLLPIDDILKIIVDIQDQLKASGWYLLFPKENPAFENNEYWRNKILNARNGASTYWQAADKYQLSISVGGYDDDNWRHEKRYLISMSVAKPWIMSNEEMDQQDREREAKAKREGRVYVPLPR